VFLSRGDGPAVMAAREANPDRMLPVSHSDGRVRNRRGAYNSGDYTSKRSYLQW